MDATVNPDSPESEHWVVRGTRGRVLFCFGPNIERCEHLAGVIAVHIAARRNARIEQAR